MENISQIGIKHNNANLQQTVIDNAASTSQCLCRLTELCRAIKLDDIETYEMFSSSKYCI